MIFVNQDCQKMGVGEVIGNESWAYQNNPERKKSQFTLDRLSHQIQRKT